jgi:ribosomal protein S19
MKKTKLMNNQRTTNNNRKYETVIKKYRYSHSSFTYFMGTYIVVIDGPQWVGNEQKGIEQELIGEKIITVCVVERVRW